MLLADADPLLGAGYDQISIPPCTARKIHVSNVPTAVDDATADAAVFLIIGCMRNFNPSMLALRQKQWRGDPPPPLGHDPEGKVLGIVGMGGIGRNLAKKMNVFGMRVIYYNRRRLPEKDEGVAEHVGFEELLKTSDVISLSLPLNVSNSTCSCETTQADEISSRAPATLSQRHNSSL